MDTYRTATIEDVARAAGVSRQTVSNVLNAPDVVRESTRERVQEAIDRLSYSPHASARRLRTRRSSTIGIHLDAYGGGISGAVLDRFLHALTESAGGRGFRVLVYAARTAEDEIRRLRDLCDGGDIDAVVLTATFHGDPRAAWLEERGVPYVSFGRPWGGRLDDPAHRWVDVDGAAGTRAATRYACEVAGPRVAFLGWPEGSGTGDDRESGWRAELGAVAGTPQCPRLVSAESVPEARRAVAEALRTDRLDAIVCASDALAVGAHVAAVAAGRPELRVVGFDNTPAADALGIPSVEQLPEQVAQRALELLIGEDGHLAGRRSDAGPSHVVVTPQLVVR